MWQFMPGTGVEMGLRIDAWVDERFDPIKSAHAAARYLKKQYQRFESWPLAMAAYNGGPGLVNAAIDKYILTGEASDKDGAVIERYHARSLHKLDPVPNFETWKKEN